MHLEMAARRAPRIAWVPRSCSPLREEVDIVDVGRTRDRVAELANDDLAADQEDAPDAAALARARIITGLVPQQPPMNDAPASMSAGRKPTNVSGVVA